MRIQVPVRILNRDHRADRVTQFNPVRLHVRTESIFVAVAIYVSGTSLSVSVAVSVTVSVSVQLEEFCTETTTVIRRDASLHPYLLLSQCLCLYRYNYEGQ